MREFKDILWQQVVDELGMKSYKKCIQNAPLCGMPKYLPYQVPQVFEMMGVPMCNMQNKGDYKAGFKGEFQIVKFSKASPFSDVDEFAKSNNFTLMGFICHPPGHFTFVGKCAGKWHKFDDNNVCEVTDKHMEDAKKKAEIALWVKN